MKPTVKWYANSVLLVLSWGSNGTEDRKSFASHSEMVNFIKTLNASSK